MNIMSNNSITYEVSKNQIKKIKMKRIFTLLVISLLITNSTFAQQTFRAFFIGNSYTAYNNLPQLIANIADSAGDSLIFASNLPGGSTLQGHSVNPNSLEPIIGGNWDFVVLQEQSQRPSFPIAQVQADVFPYAAALNDSIEKYQPCGETMFYMTWGRENGDANNCAFFPPLCTYEGMDSMLRLRYEMMADDNDAVLSPVGAVWRYLRTNHPNIDLYANDGSHPSAAGSYAAACSFYAAMFRKDPTAISFDFTLSQSDAATIRNAAKLIVFDDLLNWNIGLYDVLSDFTVSTQDSAEFSFTNTSMNTDNYLWDFGDGNTSTVENPTHTYSNFGEYIVSLTIYSCGDTLIKFDTLNAYVVSTNNLLETTTFELSPNPTEDIINIKSNIQGYNVTVYNTNGQLILQTKSNQINLSPYPKGIYFINFEFQGQRLQKRVVKQ
jgi:hypothetical protein